MNSDGQYQLVFLGLRDNSSCLEILEGGRSPTHGGQLKKSNINSSLLISKSLVNQLISYAIN